MADANIGSLPAAANVDDDALLVAEIRGVAVKITGAQLKALAEAGVEAYVTGAQEAAEKALEASAEALEAVGSIGTAVEDTQANAAASQAAQEGAEAAQSGAEEARSAIENMLVDAITLATGQPATVSKTLVDGVVKLVFGLPAGEKGDTGSKGDPGSSIQNIVRTAGTGAAGTTDTYTITLTDGSTFEFYVYNGADGLGAGDMMKSVYDPQGKNTDVFQYVDAHASDTSAHITADERAAWNAKASKPKAVPVTLTAAGWTDGAQTVAVSGVLADETAQLIQPIPSAASQAAYIEAGILCTGQAADSLTFSCETVPTEDIALYVMLQEVTA